MRTAQSQFGQHLTKAIAEGDVSSTIDVDNIVCFVVEAFTGTQMVSNGNGNPMNDDRPATLPSRVPRPAPDRDLDPNHTGHHRNARSAGLSAH